MRQTKLMEVKNKTLIFVSSRDHLRVKVCQAWRQIYIFFSCRDISAIILKFNFELCNHLFQVLKSPWILYNRSGKKPFNRFVSECCWHGTFLHSTSKITMNDCSHMDTAYMSLGDLCIKICCVKLLFFFFCSSLKCISEVVPLPARCLQAV